MTPEKLYKNANAILTAIVDANTAEAVRRDPLYWTACGRPDLEAVAELLADAAAGIDKAAGRANAAAVLKKVVKGAPAHLAGIYRDTEDGRYYAIDGFRAFRWADADYPAVPHIDDAPRGFSRCFAEGVAPVDLPTAAELKKYIAAHGLKRGDVTRPEKRYPVGPAGYNVFYLLDLIEFFGGDCTAALAADRNGAASVVSMLTAKGPAGEAILLPIRPL